MLVILEGPDGSGKSTLAAQLATELRRLRPTDEVEVLHAGVPTRHPLDEYVRPLTRYRPGENCHVIADRWHWGERVYPAALGRPTKLDAQSWWHIEHYLLRLGAVVVRCHSYPETYGQVYARREAIGKPERADVVAALPKVIAEYAELRPTAPALSYNWQSPNQRSLRSIIDVAHRVELAYADLGRFITYVGSRNPRYLLLGDVRHHLSTPARVRAADPAWSWDPAFVPFPGTSGHFLLGALRDAELTYGGAVALANACDVDDSVDLWSTLGQPRVVALGTHAARRLRRLELEHAAVPHPQYIRRFHHSRRAEYGELIRNALELGETRQWPTSSPDAPAPPSTATYSGGSTSSADRVPAVTATSSS